jgi:hypothetical protein
VVAVACVIVVTRVGVVARVSVVHLVAGMAGVLVVRLVAGRAVLVRRVRTRRDAGLRGVLV